MERRNTRQRIEDIQHTLAHVGIDRAELNQLAANVDSPAADEAQALAQDLVERAVGHLAEANLDPHAYIGRDDAELKQNYTADPRSLGHVAGALALLGTSERLLDRLEWEIHQ